MQTPQQSAAMLPSDIVGSGCQDEAVSAPDTSGLRTVQPTVSEWSAQQHPRERLTHKATHRGAKEELNRMTFTEIC